MEVELLESVQTWPPCGLALAFTPPTDGGGERLRSGWDGREREHACASTCCQKRGSMQRFGADTDGSSWSKIPRCVRSCGRLLLTCLWTGARPMDPGHAESVCGTARGCYGLPIRPPRLLPRRFAPTRKSVRLQGDKTTARWQEDKRPARICPFSRALHEGRTSASLF